MGQINIVVTTYNIYLHGSLVASNINVLNYTFSDLDFATSYTFGVQTIAKINGNIVNSMIVDVTGTTILPFNYLGATYTYSGGIYTLFYTTNGINQILASSITSLILILVGGNGGSGVNPTGTPSAQNGGKGEDGFCVIKITYP